MSEQIINSEQSLEAYFVFMRAEFEKHKYLRCTHKTGRQRTGTQNNCIHKLCEQLAQALNDGGEDMRLFFKDGYVVPFTAETVKENMWRKIQIAITGKHSTTELDRQECSQVYDVLNQNMAERGYYVPWPSKDTMPK